MFKRIVPWMNEQEWNDTFKNIYSTKIENINTGLNQITVWKSRCSAGLPVAIEVTFLLLKARLLLIKDGEVCDEVQLRMLYSMAIVMFVNLALEKYQNSITMIPLRILAIKLKIPSWMIELRHEATHKSLPQIYILKKAADFSLKYLKKNYWMKQVNHSHSFDASSFNYSLDLIDSINSSDDLSSNDENDIINENNHDITLNHNIEILLDQFFLISRKFYYNRNIQRGHLKPILKKLKLKMFKQSKSIIEIILNKINQKLTEYKEGDNILSEDFKVWWPIISLVNEYNQLNNLILFLLSMQTNEDTYKNKAVSDLILAIIKISLGENKDRNIFYLNHPSNLNGRLLIQAAMQTLNKYTKTLLICFFKCCIEPLSQISKNQLFDLIDCVNSVAMKPNVDSQDMMEHPPNMQIIFGDWTLVTDKIKWTHWPIGKCTFLENSAKQSLVLPIMEDLSEYKLKSNELTYLNNTKDISICNSNIDNMDSNDEFNDSCSHSHVDC